MQITLLERFSTFESFCGFSYNEAAKEVYAMRKKMIAMLFVLILSLSGCADVSTVPEESDNYELVTETEAAAETESTESSSFSESTESKSAKTDTALESNAEATACEPVESETPKQTEPVLQEENNVSESKPAVTESSSAPAEKPEETEPPVVIPPQTVPEDTKPKTAYDYEFDIEAVKADCIGIGLDMGLALDSSLTPSNSTWWNPVTASQNNQGEALKQSLERYITFHTVENLGAYGIDEITVFNICCEARGNGSYSIYFLFA